MSNTLFWSATGDIKQLPTASATTASFLAPTNDFSYIPPSPSPVQDPDLVRTRKPNKSRFGLGLPSVRAEGISIWNSTDLTRAGFPYLQRVEIINEKIATLSPLPHIAHVYIWFKAKIPKGQMSSVLSLSTNFMYDQEKELLIIRADRVKTALAQAALISLYLNGKVTISQIKSYNLLSKYFLAAKKKQHFKRFKQILKASV